MELNFSSLFLPSSDDLDATHVWINDEAGVAFLWSAVSQAP